MSIVSSMNIAQQALSVNQSAITVISNNIANVDTENYSKLRVNTESVVNYTPARGNNISVAESASGVSISSVQRYSDTYLQSYLRQELSSESYLKGYASIASDVQDLTNELNGTGLSKALENFYSAADALSDTPSDITARSNYVQALNNVTSAFNTVSGNLNNVMKNLVGSSNYPGSLEASDISDTKTNVNSLLDELAQVNYDIIKTNSSNSASSALLDQRDALANQLANLIPATFEEQDNGTLNISLADVDLVNGAKVKGYLGVSATVDPNHPVAISIVDPDTGDKIADNVNSSITGGAMGAILTATSSSVGQLAIPNILKELDNLASDFASVMNTIQTGSPKADGTVAMAMDKTTKTLIPTTAADVIFKTKDGTASITASNISVNSTIIADPYLVAAARVTPPANATAVGNNTNVDLIINARNNSNGPLGNATFEGYMSGIVSEVGTYVASINASYKDQKLIVSQVQTNLKSATGVNLDEELVDLVKYQRAYQASARVFSICNDLLDVLVNLGK